MEGKRQESVGEFHDWEEVDAGFDSEVVNSPKSTDGCRRLEEIEADSQGLLRLDYFSLENEGFGDHDMAMGEVSDGGSGVESDKPSWIDPCADSSPCLRGDLAGFWSDSGSDRNDDRKSEEGDLKGDYPQEGTVVKYDKLSTSEDNFTAIPVKNCAGLEESFEREVSVGKYEGNVETKVEFDHLWSDSGGDSLVMMAEEQQEERNNIKDEPLSGVTEPGEVSIPFHDKKKTLWWKIPLEMIKYYALKISPVWSFSMAAAIVGFVMLGRKLYKMKRKALNLQLKVTLDDKQSFMNAQKVSQVMSRAAKLNEAFSVVRRVPIVRPLLPPTGLSSWPHMTLR